MCRFSRLLLFSFFFCKDGSDRLMKRASYSCCNFLCIVLAAAYLKYRRCHLSCLPFVWHPFFHCDTHTHTEDSLFSNVTVHHTHSHIHTSSWQQAKLPLKHRKSSLRPVLQTQCTPCSITVSSSCTNANYTSQQENSHKHSRPYAW